MRATIANMKAVQDDPGVFAYSPFTMEEYSATPGDYWMMADDEYLRDSDGNAMVLARRISFVEELEPTSALWQAEES